MVGKIIDSKVSEGYKKALSLSNERLTNQLHIISAGSPTYDEDFEIFFTQRHIKQALQRFDCNTAMFSMIWMKKLYCITKEQCDLLYGVKDVEDKEENDKKEIIDDNSVGDDLETFIRRIQNGKITKESISLDGEEKWTFLLCLLDKKQRSKLEMKDRDFLKTFGHGNYADVPEEEWNQSEYKHLKFSRSEALRRTYCIDTELEYGSAIVNSHDQPDFAMLIIS